MILILLMINTVLSFMKNMFIIDLLDCFCQEQEGSFWLFEFIFQST